MEETYLVWSHEHHMWWRAERRGYCVSVHDAGRYSRTDAIAICKQRDGFDPLKRPSEIPVREADILDCITTPKSTSGSAFAQYPCR